MVITRSKHIYTSIFTFIYIYAHKCVKLICITCPVFLFTLISTLVRLVESERGTRNPITL